MLSLIVLFIYICAVIAPEIFFIPKAEVAILEGKSSHADELAVYKAAILGDFRTFKNTLFAIF